MFEDTGVKVRENNSGMRRENTDNNEAGLSVSFSDGCITEGIVSKDQYRRKKVALSVNEHLFSTYTRHP